jgi:glutaminyl-peptide cyclotransferase
MVIGFFYWLYVIIIQKSTNFNGRRAYLDVVAQVSFGARIPGSPAHALAVTYIQQELINADWKTQIQATEWQGFSIQNIIASRSDDDAQIIIGAHYDSRLRADQDLGSGRAQPVPGANDGASGVAVLLELARTLSKETLPVWLVFFDAEDNGGLDSRQWIMGSRAFVQTLKVKPQAAIIVDMVGDSDLNLYIERNSTPSLVAQIWTQGANLGYAKYFINSPKYSILDDHTPFLEAGIPAVDIIDFDYPYWHTTSDTLDKVSPLSLHVVGETLKGWIESQLPDNRGSN